MDKLQTYISKSISVLFHPLLMPTYAILIIFNSGTHFSFIPFEAKKLIYLLVIISTIIVPISLIPFLVNLRVVAEFSKQKGRENFFPLFITSTAFFFAYQVLQRLEYGVIDFIELLLLCSSIMALICLLISLKWKISTHLIGIGGLLGAMFFYAIIYVANVSSIIIAICLISGFIGFARLQLQKNSPKQVYVGFLTGFLVIIVMLFIGTIF
jgi:hypothetical protein